MQIILQKGYWVTHWYDIENQQFSNLAELSSSTEKTKGVIGMKRKGHNLENRNLPGIVAKPNLGRFSELRRFIVL